MRVAAASACALLLLSGCIFIEGPLEAGPIPPSGSTTATGTASTTTSTTTSTTAPPTPPSTTSSTTTTSAPPAAWTLGPDPEDWEAAAFIGKDIGDDWDVKYGRAQKRNDAQAPSTEFNEWQQGIEHPLADHELEVRLTWYPDAAAAEEAYDAPRTQGYIHRESLQNDPRDPGLGDESIMYSVGSHGQLIVRIDNAIWHVQTLRGADQPADVWMTTMLQRIGAI